MDKRRFTSWGVSFGSLALVAGMVSYLGLTNKNTTSQSNRSIQSQPASKGLDQQQSPFPNGDGQDSFGNSSNGNSFSSNPGDDQTTNDNQPSINFGDNQPTNDNGQSFSGDDGSSQNSNQFSGRGFGHHGRFDTTTGGT